MGAGASIDHPVREIIEKMSRDEVNNDLMSCLSSVDLEIYLPLFQKMSRRKLLAIDNMKLMEMGISNHRHRGAILKTFHKVILRRRASFLRRRIRRDSISSSSIDNNNIDHGTMARHSNGSMSQPSRVRQRSPHDRVRPGRWKEGEGIDSGASGRVFQALNLDTGAIIAVKEIVFSSGNADEAEVLQREIELLRSFHHPNIVRYLGAEVEVIHSKLFIFQQWIPGGNLQTLLSRFGPLPENIVSLYTKQLLEGLAYLHAHQVVHRDVKGANCLVATDGVLKLVDFGCSKQLDGKQSFTKTLKGTPYFMAPEVIRQTGHGTKADIWSLGCTVLQMLSGRPPWKGLGLRTAMELMMHISRCRQPPEFPPDLGVAAASFLTLCFERDPSKRPTARMLLLHRFVVGVNGPRGGGGGGQEEEEGGCGEEEEEEDENGPPGDGLQAPYETSAEAGAASRGRSTRGGGGSGGGGGVASGASTVVPGWCAPSHRFSNASEENDGFGERQTGPRQSKTVPEGEKGVPGSGMGTGRGPGMEDGTGAGRGTRTGSGAGRGSGTERGRGRAATGYGVGELLGEIDVPLESGGDLGNRGRNASGGDGGERRSEPVALERHDTAPSTATPQPPSSSRPVATHRRYRHPHAPRRISKTGGISGIPAPAPAPAPAPSPTPADPSAHDRKSVVGATATTTVTPSSASAAASGGVRDSITFSAPSVIRLAYQDDDADDEENGRAGDGGGDGDDDNDESNCTLTRIRRDMASEAGSVRSARSPRGPDTGAMARASGTGTESSNPGTDSSSRRGVARRADRARRSSALLPLQRGGEGGGGGGAGAGAGPGQGSVGASGRAGRAVSAGAFGDLSVENSSGVSSPAHVPSRAVKPAATFLSPAVSSPASMVPLDAVSPPYVDTAVPAARPYYASRQQSDLTRGSSSASAATGDEASADYLDGGDPRSSFDLHMRRTLGLVVPDDAPESPELTPKEHWPLWAKEQAETRRNNLRREEQQGGGLVSQVNSDGGGAYLESSPSNAEGSGSCRGRQSHRRSTTNNPFRAGSPNPYVITRRDPAAEASGTKKGQI